MLCAYPVRLSTGQRVGCGQCLNCTINKRRAWTARMLLEGEACEKVAHGQVSWTTLTYSDENLPRQSRGGRDGVPTLDPRDYQRVFKRLRKPDALGPFRFCLVGEYGDETGRPHYHALIYGPDTFHVERALRDTWEREYGHTRTRPWSVSDPGFQDRPGFSLKVARAAYCAHYATKKMSQVDSPKLLPEQHQEFWRTSRTPGIGCTRAVLELHLTNGGSQYIAENGDVARNIRIGGKMWPLHKNVRSWLREELGIPHTAAEREAVSGIPQTRPEASEEAYEHARAVCTKLEARMRSASRTL